MKIDIINSQSPTDDIIIENVDLCEFETSDQLYDKFPFLIRHPTIKLDDVVQSYDARECRLLYVMQHEYAIVDTKDCLDIIMTDDMTTCVTGILRRSNLIFLCHFDRIDSNDYEQFEQICHYMQRFDPEDDSIAFELSLIGGYKDERNTSDPLVMNILKMFGSLTKYRFRLNLFHVVSQNTERKSHYNEPRITGVAINLKNQSNPYENAKLIRPTLDDQYMCRMPIPLFSIRRMNVSMANSSRYVGIYNCVKQALEIPVLHLNHRIYFNKYAKQYFKQMLRLNDEQILNKFSTSPMVEAEHFVHEIRQIHQLLLRHFQQFGYSYQQFIRQYFPNDRPRMFRMIESNENDQNEQQNCSNSNQSLEGEKITNDSGVSYEWREIFPN